MRQEYTLDQMQDMYDQIDRWIKAEIDFVQFKENGINVLMQLSF